MINPWSILGIVAAALLSLAAMGYWQNHAGQDKCNAKWEARETSELSTANREITRLNDEARAKEREHAESINNIDANYQRKIANEKRKTDALVADLLTGSFVLHDPAGQGAGRSETGATPTRPGECDGETGSELSTTAARFLLEEAGRADAIVEQLTACQAVIVSDRE